MFIDPIFHWNWNYFSPLFCAEMFTDASPTMLREQTPLPHFTVLLCCDRIDLHTPTPVDATAAIAQQRWQCYNRINRVQKLIVQKWQRAFYALLPLKPGFQVTDASPNTLCAG